MKPKPFDSLNHFTVPTATLHSFDIGATAPLAALSDGPPATLAGARTGRPDTKTPQASIPRRWFAPCGAAHDGNSCGRSIGHRRQRVKRKNAREQGRPSLYAK